MFRRIWPQHVILCRKALFLVINPGVVSLSSITSASSARFLNLNGSVRICSSQNILGVKEKLVENRSELGNKIATIPNALCLLRIGLTPIIGYLVVMESHMTALALFAVSGITDWLDGYIARKVKNQSSLVGSVIDPVADKLLITTIFVALTYVKLIPLALTVLVILRDVGLITGGAVTRYKTMEKPITLARYFNPSISPLQVTPTSVSKVNTALQMCAVAGSLAASLSGFTGHPVLTYIYFATAATTIYSGFQYARLTRMKLIEKE
uniref:cardiolipin synthase (CMP-forming) n=1 Tax=Elaeophora elaphi TaxID=1147741 RepID=A0A0R3RPS2_9BILA